MPAKLTSNYKSHHIYVPTKTKQKKFVTSSPPISRTIIFDHHFLHMFNIHQFNRSKVEVEAENLLGNTKLKHLIYYENHVQYRIFPRNLNINFLVLFRHNAGCRFARMFYRLRFQIRFPFEFDKGRPLEMVEKQHLQVDIYIFLTELCIWGLIFADGGYRQDQRG